MKKYVYIVIASIVGYSIGNVESKKMPTIEAVCFDSSPTIFLLGI